MLLAKPLIVDLDTGLLRTDLAREEFWRALGAGGWRTLLACAPTTTGYLQNASAADLANLPMDGAVFEAMRGARSTLPMMPLVMRQRGLTAPRGSRRVLAKRNLNMSAGRRLCVRRRRSPT
jgi:gamma-glutamylcysteine synthetase